MLITEIPDRITPSEFSPTVISTEPEKNSFIPRGTVVSIKHPRVFEPILLVVQKVGDSTLHVKIPEAFLRSNVLKGDTVTCDVFIDNFECELTGYVSNIEFLYPRHMQIMVEEIKKK